MSYMTKSNLCLETFPEGIPKGQPRPIRYGQAFFTAKPTGQGTGLALSFRYDITKTHRGTSILKRKYISPGKEIKVLARHSEASSTSSEFIIQIPIL